MRLLFRFSRPAVVCLFLLTAAGQSPGGEKCALLIGVDDYAEMRTLRFCGADMRALQRRLIASGFPEKQLFLLDDKADQTKYRPVKANMQRLDDSEP
jgi:hypothetical protein